MEKQIKPSQTEKERHDMRWRLARRAKWIPGARLAVSPPPAPRQIEIRFADPKQLNLPLG